MSALFAYTARTEEGRFVAGAIQGESSEHVLAHLRTRTLFVTSLQPANSRRAIGLTVFLALPVGATARLLLFRALATLVRAGVPLRTALEVTIEQSVDRRLVEALRSVASDIESGAALSVALSRRPREFPRLFVGMVQAGELGGVLDDVLDRLATMLELDHKMRKRVAAALAYPGVVAAAAIVLVLFLISTIVPAFSGLFEQMHVQVPVTTRTLILVGSMLRSPFALLVVAAAIGSGYLAIRFVRSHERLSRRLDRLTFAFPVVGALLRKTVIARFARMFGTLLRSGVDVLGALAACQEAIGSSLYADALRTVAESLRQGTAISQPLKTSRLFDAMFLQLVRVGEETGTLDLMLLRAAEFAELDVETAIASLASIVEPALIVVIGIVVGMIVGSVLVPLYSMIGSIK